MKLSRSMAHLGNNRGNAILGALVVTGLVMALFSAAQDYMIQSQSDLRRLEVHLARTRAELALSKFTKIATMCDASFRNLTILDDVSSPNPPASKAIVTKLVSGNLANSPVFYDSTRNKADPSEDKKDRVIQLSNRIAEVESVEIKSILPVPDNAGIYSGRLTMRLKYRDGVVSPPGSPLPAWATIRPIELSLFFRSADGLNIDGCDIPVEQQPATIENQDQLCSSIPSCALANNLASNTNSGNTTGNGGGNGGGGGKQK